jgi:hypothetical protein
MRATIYLDGDEVKHTLIERWAPRTDRYLQDGPHAADRPVRVVQLSLYSNGGFVEFTDEPEESVPQETPVPAPKVLDDDIPF